MNTFTIAQKLWNYCSDLRDDGKSYGDYVEAIPAFLRPWHSNIFIRTVAVFAVPQDGRRRHSATAPALPYLAVAGAV